jgi:hypothetical protein
MKDSWSYQISLKIDYLLSKLVVRKEKIWISWLERASPLVWYVGALLSFLNIILFLSFAVRLKRLDPVFALIILVGLYPLLYLAWRNTVDFIGKSQIFKKSLFIPDLLRIAIGAVLFGLCLIAVLGGLVWSILIGNLLVFLIGIIAGFLFYQWSSVMIYPATIEIKFENTVVQNSVLIFPDWLILKVLVLYLFCVELSILAVFVTPFVFIVDIIRAWNVTLSNVPFLYATSLMHQGIWTGALVSPLVGYVLLQGWIFLWEVLKKVWSNRRDDKEENNEN